MQGTLHPGAAGLSKELLSLCPGCYFRCLARPPATLPMDMQEPFWRALFEHPLHREDRTFHHVGSTIQELLDPISSDEVAKALSTMKDCTPGPDSRKLKDVRALPPNQLVAHYDLWLLPGYLPSALRQGETILLPKEEGVGARRSSVRSRYHR